MNIDSKKNLILDNLPHRFDVEEFDIRWSLEHKELYAIQGHAGAKLPCPIAYGYLNDPILKEDETYGTIAVSDERDGVFLLKILAYKNLPNNNKEVLDLEDFYIRGPAHSWLQYFEDIRTSELCWRPQQIQLELRRDDYGSLVCEQVLTTISGKDFTHETETLNYQLPTRSFPIAIAKEEETDADRD